MTASSPAVSLSKSTSDNAVAMAMKDLYSQKVALKELLNCDCHDSKCDDVCGTMIVLTAVVDRNIPYSV